MKLRTIPITLMILMSCCSLAVESGLVVPVDAETTIRLDADAATAQFCNFEDKPDLIQEMSLDPELSAIMFAEWQNAFLASLSGDMGFVELKRKLEEYDHSYAVDRLHDYLDRSYAAEEVEQRLGPSYTRYRPVIEYFVGYRIFHEIHRHDGRDGFIYAMTHPSELLTLYRAISSADASLPQVSPEMAESWASL